ncbi:MAG: beta-glucosidase [Anaerolineales bacterium]
MLDIDELIDELTLEEKASLCSGLDFWHLKGIERLGIPSITVTDGPHGLRKQAGSGEGVAINDSVPATCFPTASALAATWNRDLVYQVGQAIGEECRQEKVGVLLGPGANVKRSPLCGRNFEYFSEDPYLSGEMAKSHIQGVQSQGIGASLKHYAVNNQEFRRMTIDVIVDERALREIYLGGFEIAVKDAQPWTVMAAYNKVNGQYCCENRYLVRDLLKKEWQHEGLVMSDWGAMNDRVAGLRAGIDLEMPGTKNGNDQLIVKAVKEKRLDVSVLDQAVERILKLIFAADETLSEDFEYDAQAHHALARKVAGEGAVLLKNEGGILPLDMDAKVAIIGEFAKRPRYQGAGSSLINPTRLDNLYDQVSKIATADTIPYARGYPEKGDQVDESLIGEAVRLARDAEIVVVCAGLTDFFEVEGLDREHMRLPQSHNALIEALSKEHDKVVVVLSNGSPVEMPWIENVQAVLEGYLGGQAGAGAIADILYGQVNPSGKLAETFPIKLEDNPSYHYFPGGPKTVEYRESIYVGYRYYDSAGIEPLFPFGHGLSYTSFEYKDLQISPGTITDQDELTVTLSVKNSGELAGKEIVQLYVRDIEASVFRPEKELKGFEKVTLKPGEQKPVSFRLNKRAFAYYSTVLRDWCVESGEFEILVGASSRDIRLSGIVNIDSSQLASDIDGQDPAAYKDMSKGVRISKGDFETLLGSALPENTLRNGEPYTINTPISDMQGSFIGRLIGSYMKRQVDKLIASEDQNSPTALLMSAIVKEAPLRMMLMTGNGVISREMLEALLIMINGRTFKGLGALISAAWNK